MLIKVIHGLLRTCPLPRLWLCGLLVLLMSAIRLSLLLHFLIAPLLQGLSLSHNSAFIQVILITHVTLARVFYLSILLLILRYSLLGFSSATVVHLLFALISPCILLLCATIVSFSSIGIHSLILFPGHTFLIMFVNFFLFFSFLEIIHLLSILVLSTI